MEPKPRSKHLLMLYLIIALLLSCMGIALLGVPGCGKGKSWAQGREGVVADPAEAVCSTMEGHYDVALTHWDRSQGDPWQQVKWVGEPAFCKVRGHLIEKIDDDNNFRRGFALKHSANVEDRLHILPWLYGSRVDLNRSPRRVYLDLGANAFRTSVLWYSQIYPCDFTEIHAFEKETTLFKMPTEGFAEEENWASQPIWNSVRVKQRPELPQWVLDRITLYNKFVADGDDESSQSVNITRFIKEELRLKAEDTVVVKMDIEGAEWPILQRWIEDPEMAQIVDELFVEIHYEHPSMREFGWSMFKPRTRDEAKRLLAQLRWRGFFAHFWP